MNNALNDSSATQETIQAYAATPSAIYRNIKTHVIIVRHGNTFDQTDTVRRVGKRTDLPLSTSGQKQAQALGFFLRKLHDNKHPLIQDLGPLAAVFTSSLKRTQETADIALSTAGIDLIPKPSTDFDEIDYGPDENQPESLVIKRLGEETLNAWETNNTPPPGWKVNPDGLKQTWRDFFQKVALDYTGKTVIVVTSNGIARFAPSCLATFSAWRKQHGFKLATGSVAVFEHDGLNWDCLQWNIKPDP